ncbi:MAG: hypothetical protein AAFP04_03640 [Myxococcota bacterium]
MVRQPALLAVSTLAVAATLGVSSAAHADAGERQLEAIAGYRTRDSADALVGVRVGLSDFISARARGGIRFSEDNIAGRLELSSSYAFDVLTWVPEISVGAAIDVDDVDVELSGLASIGARYYVSRDRFIALELGGELGPDEDLGLLMRLVYAF